MSEGFYSAFEERYRGPRSLIKARLQVYISFVEPLKKIYQDLKTIDLGCGRGEWLELLTELGFDAHGVDVEDQMLGPCRELHLNVQLKDALEALRSLADESQVVVSGFHIAEHISFSDLQNLVQEALRVLKPAGLLILETPNPENILVGTTNFYLDPTHIRPIPPLLLSFLPEFYGFERVKILRLQEALDIKGTPFTSLIDVLAGVSPDYSVVAQKSNSQELLAIFDQPFGVEYGVTLGELSEKYDQTNRKNTIALASLANKEAECAKELKRNQETAQVTEQQLRQALWHGQHANAELERKLTTQLLQKQEQLSQAAQEYQDHKQIAQKEIQRLSLTWVEKEKSLTNQAAQIERQASLEKEALLISQAQREKEYRQQLQTEQIENRRLQQEFLQYERLMNNQLSTLQTVRHTQQLQAQQHQSDLSHKEQEIDRLIASNLEIRTKFNSNLYAEKQNQLNFEQEISRLKELLNVIHKSITWRLAAPVRRLVDRMKHADRMPAGANVQSPLLPKHSSQSSLGSMVENQNNEQTILIKKTELSMNNKNTIGLDFQVNSSGIYQLNDFLCLYDKEFVQAAYVAILKRPVDPQGLTYYLQRVRSGVSKERILAQILKSTEAKSSSTKIQGLSAYLLFDKFLSVPMLGALVAFVVFIFTIKTFMRDMRVLENHIYRISSHLASRDGQNKKFGDE